MNERRCDSCRKFFLLTVEHYASEQRTLTQTGSFCLECSKWLYRTNLYEFTVRNYSARPTAIG